MQDVGLYTRGEVEEIQAGVFSPEAVTTTFDGTAGNGAIGTVDLYTVKQDGLVAIYGDCTADLTGASATIEVGISGSTAGLIPQTTATTLDNTGRIDRSGVIATSVSPNVTPFFPVRAGDVIQITVATADVTGGTVKWRMLYRSFNGSSQSVSQSGTANTPSIQTGATALAANPARKGWQIQNVGTNPLFVLLGSGASTTVFHAVLKGGTGDSDGLGGSISQDSVVYTGIITVAGTTPKYVVTEL